MGIPKGFSQALVALGTLQEEETIVYLHYAKSTASVHFS